MSEQDKNLAGLNDPATEPIDLAQAFKMYNEANRATTEPSVDDGEADGSQVESSQGDGLGAGGEPEGGDAQVDPSIGSSDDGAAAAGGSTDFIEPIDFNARKAEILKEIQQDAIYKVRQEFSQNNIVPCSIEDLYQRDEQTGRVSFKNPDDPTRDFASRAEAQQWVDAFNKQIENRFRQEINKKQQQLVNESLPKLRLIEFAPKFNELDENTKAILDDLTEPYSVRDANGDVIGFSVDLDAMLAQAKKIAQRFPAQQQPQASDDGKQVEEPKDSGRPAYNMPTGTGKTEDELEPKTIGEALKMYDKQQREKGSRK